MRDSEGNLAECEWNSGRAKRQQDEEPTGVGHVKWSRSRDGGCLLTKKKGGSEVLEPKWKWFRKRIVGDDAWQDKVMQANAGFDLDYLFQDGR